MLFGGKSQRFRAKLFVRVEMNRQNHGIVNFKLLTITQDRIFWAELLKQNLTPLENSGVLTDLFPSFDPLSSVTLNKAKQTPESISVNFHIKLQQTRTLSFSFSSWIHSSKNFCRDAVCRYIENRQRLKCWCLLFTVTRATASALCLYWYWW